jgi:DNA invertase Pin-like site-specific DNA recombinase
VKAVSYLRTSSATNVGADKDSGKRQREAIAAFAERADFALVGEFYDEAVSGTDKIEDRPGFAALLDRIDSNGVRTVIVEDQSRFARDMQAHVLGLALLRGRGVTLLTAGGANLTDDTDEMTEAMIHIAAVFAELEKKRLVKKLRVARERSGKLGGRQSLAAAQPDLAKRAHELRGQGLTLRAIGEQLADGGKPMHPATVRALVDGPQKRAKRKRHVKRKAPNLTREA